MSPNVWIPWIDTVTAAALLCMAVRNLAGMTWKRKQCYALLNGLVAICALAVMASAFSGGDIRYWSHVGIQLAFAVLVYLGRRASDRMQERPHVERHAGRRADDKAVPQ